MAIFFTGKPQPTKVASGNLTADGTEQSLLEYSGTGKIFGTVSLDQMESNDVVIISLYLKTASGKYKRYWEEPYKDKQDNPLVLFPEKYSENGIKITLKQTAGTFKRFEHSFLKA